MQIGVRTMRIRVLAMRIRVLAMRIRVLAIRIRVLAIRIRVPAIRIRVPAMRIRVLATRIRVLATHAHTIRIRTCGNRPQTSAEAERAEGAEGSRTCGSSAAAECSRQEAAGNRHRTASHGPVQRAASPVQHALLRSCCSRLSGRHGYSRGSQQPCAVRCVQKEAAARIEAEIEPARHAFEKPRTRGMKGKGQEACAARPAEGRAARSTRRNVAPVSPAASVGACDRSPTIGVRWRWRWRWRWRLQCSACHGATTGVLCKQQRTRLQPRQQSRRHTAACTALWIGHATSTIHLDAYQRIEQRMCAAARRRRCSAALRWHLQCGAVAVRRHSFLPCSGAQRHWAAGRTSRPSRPSCGRSRRGSIGLPDTNAEQPRAPLRSGRQAPHRTAGPVRACVSSSRFRMARQAPLPRTVARKLQWWAVTPSALPCLRASSVISSRSFKTRGRCRCTFRPLSCHRIPRRAVLCRAVDVHSRLWRC